MAFDGGGGSVGGGGGTGPFGDGGSAGIEGWGGLTQYIPIYGWPRVP